MDDKEIISLLKRKPEIGIEEATYKYSPMVKGIAIKILHTRNLDVEECIADTFISLWKNVKKVDLKKGSLKAYIACIARNTAINRYNKLKRDKTDYIEERDYAQHYNIEDELILKCDMEHIQKIIKDMGEPDNEIFTRRFFLFQRVKEIAGILGVTEKVVESRIYRGRKKLKRMLEAGGVL